MRAEETAIIAVSINELYGQNTIETKEACAIWHNALLPYTYEEVTLALETYISTGTKRPLPADIISCIQKQKPAGNQPAEEEAWAMVAKACANGNYGYKEEFEKLPPIIQQAVGRAENIRSWAAVEESTFHTVIHSNFLRAYKAAVARKKEFDALPEKMKNIVEGITKRIEEKG